MRVEEKEQNAAGEWVVTGVRNPACSDADWNALQALKKNNDDMKKKEKTENRELRRGRDGKNSNREKIEKADKPAAIDAELKRLKRICEIPAGFPSAVKGRTKLYL